MPESSRPLRVFLCHAWEDKSAVRDLYGRLNSEGVQCWLDEEDLLPGQDWEREISQEIRKTNVVLACLSQHSVMKTGYVQKEIRLALDAADEQPEGAIFIIPVKLEECELPDRLKRLQWVNLYEAGGYEKLIRSLKARAGTLEDVVMTPRAESQKPASEVKEHTGLGWNPPEACAYLSHIRGFQTRGYKSLSGGKEYFCSSDYMDLGDDFPLPNNIAYYAEGDERSVKKLKLVLNVNVRQKAAEAHIALATYSEDLTSKALGMRMPESLKEAILLGGAAQWKANDNLVEVKRDDWPTGRGYELHYVIRKAALTLVEAQPQAKVEAQHSKLASKESAESATAELPPARKALLAEAADITRRQKFEAKRSAWLTSEQGVNEATREFQNFITEFERLTADISESNPDMQFEHVMHGSYCHIFYCMGINLTASWNPGQFPNSLEGSGLVLKVSSGHAPLRELISDTELGALAHARYGIDMHQNAGIVWRERGGDTRKFPTSVELAELWMEIMLRQIRRHGKT